MNCKKRRGSKALSEWKTEDLPSYTCNFAGQYEARKTRISPIIRTPAEKHFLESTVTGKNLSASSKVSFGVIESLERKRRQRNRNRVTSKQF